MSKAPTIYLVDGVKHKHCSTCKELKPWEAEFYKKGPHRDSRCRACRSKHTNRDKARAAYRARHAANPEFVRKQSRDSHRKESKEVKAKRTREWRAKNPTARIAHSLRARLRDWLEKIDTEKSIPTLTLLGCDIVDFRKHLESLWQPGMTWENYGRWEFGQPMKWHIDHIKPCASFNLIDEEQQKLCFHWTNMQPMWAQDNLSKSDSIKDHD